MAPPAAPGAALKDRRSHEPDLARPILQKVRSMEKVQPEGHSEGQWPWREISWNDILLRLFLLSLPRQYIQHPRHLPFQLTSVSWYSAGVQMLVE